MKCIGPKAKDASVSILIGEEVRRILQEGSRLEVEHVKVHRSKKEKQNMTSFERVVTDGKERADEMAKDGAGSMRKWLRSGPTRCSRVKKRFAQHCSCVFVSVEPRRLRL